MDGSRLDVIRTYRYEIVEQPGVMETGCRLLFFGFRWDAREKRSKHKGKGKRPKCGFHTNWLLRVLQKESLDTLKMRRGAHISVHWLDRGKPLEFGFLKGVGPSITCMLCPQEWHSAYISDSVLDFFCLEEITGEPWLLCGGFSEMFWVRFSICGMDVYEEGLGAAIRRSDFNPYGTPPFFPSPCFSTSRIET
ncbi:predicted protein [Coccidioides posadasii str. Silveira]|uniref:Predicted protein n=1 Tax=Coccidioides posadasii (strain RMSCC 757 / Silveira) TaxID=443226 RepID=E9D9J4_COCPS|nr:predicted protein [Coccidioides posadasii str. Silveira]